MNKTIRILETDRHAALLAFLLIGAYHIIVVGECCAVGVTTSAGITKMRSDKAYRYHEKQFAMAVKRLTRACEMLKLKIAIRLDLIDGRSHSDLFALQRFYISEWRFILRGTKCLLSF